MEQHTFVYEGQAITYQLDRGKRRHCYLSIDSSGVCIVKVPSSATSAYIESLLRQKGAWILQKTAQIRRQMKPPLDYVSGEVVPVWGKDCVLSVGHWDQKSAHTSWADGVLKIQLPKVGNDKENAKQALRDFYFEQVTKQCAPLLAHWETAVGVHAEEIKVKWMKSSWGRCRSSGAISIHALLAAYPQECLGYVILHEVCHLRHMNHSAPFWALVESQMPDYVHFRDLLKKPMDFLGF